MQTYPNNKIGVNLADSDRTQNTQTVAQLRIHDSPLARTLYIGAGFTALVLGMLGIVLPILPTTPFVLLAAYCFARSSAYFHNKLLSNCIAGPIIVDWCQYRSIPQNAKYWAYLLMTISFSVSILLVPAVWQKTMLVIIAIVLASFIWRIPVRDAKTAHYRYR